MPVADKVTVELELRDQQYNARLKASEREFQRSMDATERAAENAARDIERTMGALPESLRRQYRELGVDIGRSLMTASRVAGVAFGAITAYSVNAARKAEDINDAFSFTFTKIGADADQAATKIADSFERTQTQIKANLTNSYQILTGVGIDATRSFQAAQAVTARSIDLASQKGITDARAYEAIISGLTGETEPLKRLGVVLNEAAVGAELVRIGFKGKTSEASEAQKTIARLNLILKGTATAEGDVARTADSANNKLKAAQTQFENAAVALGNELLPAFVAVTGAATDTLKAFNDLPGGVQVAGLAFLGLIAAGGPIAGLIANLARVIKLAQATRAAIIAAGAAGGTAGGAAAGGGLLGALGVSGLGIAAGVGSSSFVRAPERDAATVRRNLEAARRLRPNDTRTITYLERELETATFLEDRLKGINQLMSGGAATDPESGVVGGFGLGSLGNTGTGAGSGGRRRAGRSGPSESDLRAMREEIRINNELTLARARNDTYETNRLQRLSDINDLTERYQRAEIDNARELATIQVDALANAEAAARGRASIAERTRSIIDTVNQEVQRQRDQSYELDQALGERRAQDKADRAAYERDTYREYAHTFVDAIRNQENVFSALGETFANAASDNLGEALSNLLLSLFSQQQGAGLNPFAFLGFGGGRAAGGAVRAGMSYDVGENGREKFVPAVNGFVVPNAALRGGRSTMVDARTTLIIQNPVGTDAIMGGVRLALAESERRTLQTVKATAPVYQQQNQLLRG